MRCRRAYRLWILLEQRGLNPRPVFNAEHLKKCQECRWHCGTASYPFVFGKVASEDGDPM